MANNDRFDKVFGIIMFMAIFCMVGFLFGVYFGRKITINKVATGEYIIQTNIASTTNYTYLFRESN